VGNRHAGDTDERFNHAEKLTRRKGRKYPKPTDERTDGLGNALVADALYYVQDSRVYVGNCGSWWAPDCAGYCCSIDEAGHVQRQGRRDDARDRRSVAGRIRPSAHRASRARRRRCVQSQELQAGEH
jgi:hypothetical protein